MMEDHVGSTCRFAVRGLPAGQPAVGIDAGLEAITVAAVIGVVADGVASEGRSDLLPGSTRPDA